MVLNRVNYFNVNEEGGINVYSSDTRDGTVVPRSSGEVIPCALQKEIVWTSLQHESNGREPDYDRLSTEYNIDEKTSSPGESGSASAQAVFGQPMVLMG